MRYNLVLILILMLIITTGNSVKAQTGVPIIVNNNTEYIEEYINPVILNWSVTDENLREHKIFQNNDLIDRDTYNLSELVTIDITLAFNLGRGEYNFTLQVQDASNNVVTNSVQIVKGTEVDPDLADLSDLNFINFWIPSLLCLILVKKKSKQTKQ